MGGDSAGVLDTGATADLVRLKWLGNHNLHPERQELLRISLYPASARFKFGDERLGEVRLAAGITVGIAGRKGTPAAFASEAGIPALLRKLASGGPGSQSDFASDVSTIQNRGDEILLKVNGMGYYVPSFAFFSERPQRLS